MYFLDTNTCIYFLNGKYESIKTRILETPPGNIYIPSIVKAELLLGAFKSNNKNDTTRKVEQFLKPFEIIPFTNQMTYIYAKTRSQLEIAGKIIGPNDLLIASTVIFYNGILVSHNIGEFKRIKNLNLESW